MAVGGRRGPSGAVGGRRGPSGAVGGRQPFSHILFRKRTFQNVLTAHMGPIYQIKVHEMQNKLSRGD